MVWPCLGARHTLKLLITWTGESENITKGPVSLNRMQSQSQILFSAPCWQMVLGQSQEAGLQSVQLLL